MKLGPDQIDFSFIAETYNRSESSEAPIASGTDKPAIAQNH